MDDKERAAHFEQELAEYRRALALAGIEHSFDYRVYLAQAQEVLSGFVEADDAVAARQPKWEKAYHEIKRELAEAKRKLESVEKQHRQLQIDYGTLGDELQLLQAADAAQKRGRKPPEGV